jgi:hypothetical protein
MGGGYFVEKNVVYLYADAKEHPEKGQVPNSMQVLVYNNSYQMTNRPDWYAVNGWILTQERVWEYPPGRCLKPQVWSKEGEGGKYALSQMTPDFHQYSYSLKTLDDDQTIPMTDVTWADWDQRGRLVFTRHGKLFAVPPSGTIDTATEIGDFTDRQFEEVVAPEWARNWS